MVGRCPCRGWRATMVHGRAEIGWLKMVTVQLSTFLFPHFNSLPHRYGGGSHFAYGRNPKSLRTP